MNIIQLHERVRFLLDIVASPRMESEDIDNALNGEISQLVREKYDQTRVKNRSDAFQITQRVRDELQSLVEYHPFDLPSPSIIAIETVLDGFEGWYVLMGQGAYEKYLYMLSMRMKMVSGAIYRLDPISQDELNVISKNPFRRVRTGNYPKAYYHEIAPPEELVTSGGYWKLVFDGSGGDNPIQKGIECYYLKEPAIVNYGVERDSTYTFSNGTWVIAVQATVYAGADYVIGEKFQIVNPNNNITSGLVVHNFVESDLPGSLHEELCRRAASTLLVSAGESEKAKEISAQVFST